MSKDEKNYRKDRTLWDQMTTIHKVTKRQFHARQITKAKCGVKPREVTYSWGTVTCRKCLKLAGGES